jgi:DNA modification methylase
MSCTDLFDKLNVKFDLILSDPPYNIGKDFGNDSDQLPLDVYLKNMENVLSKCSSLLTEKGSIVWFCTHKYVGRIQNIMYDLGLNYRRMLIWYYLNGMSRQKRTPITEYEPILWFSKSDDFIYNVDEMRIPYRTDRVKTPCYKKDSKGVKRAWMPNPLGALRGDVWKYPVLSGNLYQKERTDHPTQKPETLITDLIRAFCPIDDKVYNGCIFDPFIGSGTTAVCCEKLNTQGNNITWAGSEIESKWVQIAEERLKNAKM